MTDSHPHPPRTAVDPSGRDAEGGAVDTGDGSGDPLPLLRTKTPTPHVAPSAPQSGKSPTERSYRILRRLAFAGASGVLCAVLGLAALFWYYGRDLPAVSTLAEYRPPQTTRVYDRHGQVMGEIFLERRTVVPMRRIAKAIVACVLAAEDADFFSHRGLDYPGIVRALVRDLVAGRPAQGASTITQQVVKLMLLNSERTIARKVRELILARRLEQQLSKRQILHLYLNHINFGHGRYGVQEAARFYFGKDAADLSLAEASRIAGIPQAPARLSPRSHPAANRRRQLYVLRQLEDKRDKLWPGLQVADIKAARQAELQLAPASATEHSATNAMAVVRRRVQRWLDPERILQGGLSVHSTLDGRLQQAAQKALQAGLRRIDRRHGYQGPLRPARRARQQGRVRALRVGRHYWATVTGADANRQRVALDIAGHPGVAEVAKAQRRYNPKGLPLHQWAPVGRTVRVSILRLLEDARGGVRAEAKLELGPEGAVVVIDVPSREIRALVGGYAQDSGFNRAVAAVRQPGSSFKPIVYALALQSRKFTPATLVLDAPVVYEGWQPGNYRTAHYEGWLRLRQAVAQSINAVAVRVLESVGPAQVVDFATALGITTPLQANLALALGASEVRPIELANAYATFAAGGQWAPYRLVRGVQDAGGKALAMPPPERPRQVMSAAESYVLTQMLRSVVSEGTGRAAAKLPFFVVGKTGTSNGARDAWFVGYSRHTAIAVWVGFDDRRPLGRKESGGRSALPIWVAVMRAASRGNRPADFERPAEVEQAAIDPATGKLAYPGMPEAMQEVFLAGTAPTQVALAPQVADTESFLMQEIAGEGEAIEGEAPATPPQTPP